MTLILPCGDWIFGDAAGSEGAAALGDFEFFLAGFLTVDEDAEFAFFGREAGSAAAGRKRASGRGEGRQSEKKAEPEEEGALAAAEGIGRAGTSMARRDGERSSAGEYLHTGDPWKNSEGENLFERAHGIAAAIDAIVGLLEGGQALEIEAAKADFVAEERAVGDLGAAAQQFLDGALQPDERGAMLTEQGKILGLVDGAAAERNDARLAEFEGFADDAEELLVLELAGIRVLRRERKFGGWKVRADSVMRLSRSMFSQPIWRASRRPMVDLPLPMKPVRQTRAGGRESFIMKMFEMLPIARCRKRFGVNHA